MNNHGNNENKNQIESQRRIQTLAEHQDGVYSC